MTTTASLRLETGHPTLGTGSSTVLHGPSPSTAARSVGLNVLAMCFAWGEVCW